MISEEHESQLRRLNQVFIEENRKLNLSAFREEEQSWIGNVMDSLSILDPPLLLGEGLGVRYNNSSKISIKILDIGTGGGFPLLPLAICLPECELTGIDATQKKITAVERISEKLDIKNIKLVTGRAEELGHDSEHREQYDLVLSRAVAPINTLLEFCAPFCKVKGHIVLWKSMKIDQELEDSLLARAELTCHLIDQYEYELPESFGKRQLLIFEKTSATDKKYPRKVGEPKKNPIF
ncbi:16S rRNA (guanine(527)-N(7))-methyltransferase RsmG [Patescibacteria group bacterium]|nr:16S rRNA (guanine(527)-N(7))-methyltransferase RsmG [Patescibacteria group bacterium]MBU1122972.1 16S rRNA (guanine(527)-N(7))-methyltransferase RsmG [Patescibacteria group bacterium]MBU1911177.1 16S rRNA (guanine(527)-N(7))-methyltransferase RsmG [Patescibacteria group bacterium]